MMSNGIFVSKEHNLLLAWADTFSQLMDRGVSELTPKIITVKDLNRYN